MPPQPSLLAPTPLVTQVPGAQNLGISDLTLDDIVAIATAGSVSAQTTLEKLAAFLSGQTVISVDNYAALVALKTRPTYVFMLGFTTPYDGGGGLFYWQADSVAAANVGLVVACTSGPAGRYIRSYAGPVLPQWFGVDKTGVHNTTTQLLGFFNALVAGGLWGRIPGGTYMVTEGVLVFDNNFTDKLWPQIDTDGYNSVFFQAAGLADAPLFTMSNGTATSGVGKYWRGGSLGGITFVDATGQTSPNRHGMSLRGIYGISFGFMKFNNMGGDGVNVPFFRFGGTNPDPYACTSISWDGISAAQCQGFGLRNLNGAGMDSWKIGTLSVVNGVSGGWYGTGGGTSVFTVSFGDVGGWGIDDGGQAGVNGGSRNEIGRAEFDNVENGIRLNRESQSSFREVRFVHRFQSGINPAAVYWPRNVVSLGGGVSPRVKQIEMPQMLHRIEAGGTTADLGTFVDGHNDSGVAGVQIDQSVSDEGPIGVISSMLYTRMSNTVALLTQDLQNIWDSRRLNAMQAHGSAAATLIPNSGLGTLPGLQFPTGEFDPALVTDPNTHAVIFGYDATTSQYTIGCAGRYKVVVSFPLTIAAGTRIRLGVLLTRSAVTTTIMGTYLWSVVLDRQTYMLEGSAAFIVGDKIGVTCDQNTAAATVPVDPSNNPEVFFRIEKMGD